VIFVVNLCNSENLCCCHNVVIILLLKLLLILHFSYFCFEIAYFWWPRTGRQNLFLIFGG
jgi:hypothetical protein